MTESFFRKITIPSEEILEMILEEIEKANEEEWLKLEKGKNNGT